MSLTSCSSIRIRLIIIMLVILCEQLASCRDASEENAPVEETIKQQQSRHAASSAEGKISFRFKRPAKLERRVNPLLLPLRLLVALLRLLLLPLRILLAPLIILLRALLRLLRVLILLLINPFVLIFEGLFVAANIARIVLTIIARIMIILRIKKRREKDEHEQVEVITIVEEEEKLNKPNEHKHTNKRRRKRPKEIKKKPQGHVDSIKRQQEVEKQLALMDAIKELDELNKFRVKVCRDRKYVLPNSSFQYVPNPVFVELFCYSGNLN